MKLYYLFLIFSLFLISCETDSTSESSASTVESDTVTIADINIDEPIVNHQDLKFSDIAEYELMIPDTTLLFQEWKEKSTYHNLAQLYLSNYYNVNSEMDNIEYYGEEKSMICAFDQTFDFHIKYSYSGCGEEGGASEKITLPKTNTSEVKKLIQTLFYDSWNTWISETEYGPDGAGCYYEIIQQENQTEIEIYCGC